MYYDGQHFGTAAAAGVINGYADGVNLHSDGLPNEPKRTHLAALHAVVMEHQHAIMGTARPIPQTPLGGGAAGLTAFEFGPGLAFLENANGSPGLAVDEDCAFPIDTSTTRYKGLAAAAGTISSETACAAACCVAGDKCNVYEWYGIRAPGQASQCWVGTPVHAEGTPPAAYKSRAKHVVTPGPPPSPPPPSPGPSPGPSPPSGESTVQWKGRTFRLPEYSVLIVNSTTGAVLFMSRNTSAAPRTTRLFTNATQAPLAWDCWSELDQLRPNVHPNAVWAPSPREQLNLTKDRTEYLFYFAHVPAQAHGTTVMLTIGGRISNAYSIFVNGGLVGTTYDATHSYGSKAYSIDLDAAAFGGQTEDQSTWSLAILSTSIGMHSHVTSRALDFKGITGSVALGGTDITRPAGGWSHVVGLRGELLGARLGNTSLGWSAAACGADASPPLTWRKATFELDAAPIANRSVSVMLDVSGMSRGHFYLNGHDLGKFWTVGSKRKGPTQRYYQLPSSLLQSSPATNLVVLADEMGAQDPSGVRVVLSTMQPVMTLNPLSAG